MTTPMTEKFTTSKQHHANNNDTNGEANDETAKQNQTTPTK
ncbi:3115_t:CDS:2 [Dentiscutata erythropus]|uniref:3115_t:CDS:1 n=1 Tax=Dentiscutata erythropus TaxID=1348616 RepID=A0A9N9H8N6_9GLOM|nr:3115_t:CDS:2 [Dentiscutata erythropus]